MADVAQVHPEPGPQRQQQQQRQQQRGLPHRVVSSVGRAVEQLSRLYGYALLISGIDAVFIAGISALPLTKWDDQGVPRADVVCTGATIDIAGAVAFGAASVFHFASTDPFPDPAHPHVQGRYAWSGFLPMHMVASTITSGCLVFTPLALGANPRYYLLLVASRFSTSLISPVLGDIVMSRQYQGEFDNTESQLAQDIAGAAPQQRRAGNGGFWASAVKYSNSMLLFSTVCGYPLLILPYFGAETTSEYVKPSP